MNKVVFYDVETSGLEVGTHEIIQLAAVVYGCYWTENGLILEEAGYFQNKARFNLEVASPEALEINNYDPDVWEKEAVCQQDVIVNFCKFLRAHATVPKISAAGKSYTVAQLAGYNNIKFDSGFVRASAANMFFPASFHELDVMQLSLVHQVFFEMDTENLKLETVATYLGLTTVPQTHDALDDVRLTAAVFQELMKTI